MITKKFISLFKKGSLIRSLLELTEDFKPNPKNTRKLFVLMNKGIEETVSIEDIQDMAKKGEISTSIINIIRCIRLYSKDEKILEKLFDVTKKYSENKTQESLKLLCEIGSETLGVFYNKEEGGEKKNEQSTKCTNTKNDDCKGDKE